MHFIMKLFSIFQFWLFAFSLGSIDCVMDLCNWLLALSFVHLHISYDLYYYLSICYLSLRWNSLLMHFWQTLSLCSWGYDNFSRTWVYCKGHHFIHSSGLLITSWKKFVDSVNYVFSFSSLGNYEVSNKKLRNFTRCADVFYNAEYAGRSIYNTQSSGLTKALSLGGFWFLSFY